MDNAAPELLKKFEQLDIAAPDFHHVDHVKVAYQMLDKYDFVEACTRYAATIRTMAESVGAYEKFNITITFAFMSLIAERKNLIPSDLKSFLESNSDLLNRNVLHDWYTEKRLASPAARCQFLLPDRVPADNSRNY